MDLVTWLSGCRRTFKAYLILSLRGYHKTLMVVEDNPDDQWLIETAFRKIGLTGPIYVLGDGAEAIDYMCGEGRYADREKFPYPTFITTDLKMPKVDGFAVLEFLQKNPEWKVIPTVVLSGSQDQDDIQKAYRLGANSYHVKPATNEQLRQQLKTLHDYWLTCEVPVTDSTGKQLKTDSQGKLGERYSQDSTSETKPRR